MITATVLKIAQLMWRELAEISKRIQTIKHALLPQWFIAKNAKIVPFAHYASITSIWIALILTVSMVVWQRRRIAMTPTVIFIFLFLSKKTKQKIMNFYIRTDDLV